MNEEERPLSQEQEEQMEKPTLDAIARNIANQMSSVGKSLAENAPGLVDKLVNPKIIADSPYHGILPSLNFGNFTDDPSGVVSDLQAEILFLMMDASNNGWLEDWMAKKHAAAWTVTVEESKGRGNERMSRLFFGQEVGVTLKKEKPKSAMEK